MSTNNSDGLFQMDCGAVDQAFNEILHGLGITKKGDIVSLCGYCRQKLQQAINAARKGTQEETKRKLLMEFSNQRKRNQRRLRVTLTPSLYQKVKQRRMVGFTMNNEGGFCAPQQGRRIKGS